MAIIKATNVDLAIPILGKTDRLFHTSNYSDSLVGSEKKIEDRKVSSYILSNLNFEFTDGDKVGLIGHNGSGKTSLLRLINKIYHPSTGELTLEGSMASLMDIGLMLSPECSGYQNIKILCLHFGFKIKESNIIEKVTEFSGLGEFLHLPVKTYSSGMQARLVFSISSMIRKEILLMDEGIYTGDLSFKTKAGEILSGLLVSAKIIIFASHDLEFIRSQCNKLILLKKGKMNFFEEVDKGIEFYQSPEYLKD